MILSMVSVFFGIYMAGVDNGEFYKGPKFMLLVIWSLLVFASCALWFFEIVSITKPRSPELKTRKTSGASYAAIAITTPVLGVELFLGMLFWAFTFGRFVIWLFLDVLCASIMP